MQRGFLIFLPSRLVPRLVCPQNLRNISLVAQIAAFEALPNSFHCRSTSCRICSTMAGSTGGGGTAGAAPCPQQASTARVRKTALRRPCRLRSRKAGGGWSFRNLLRWNKTNQKVTPACPSAPQPRWTGKCNDPTTYDRTGGVNGMDLSSYKIQEVFQSATLRERKRNLRRLMEEYIATMLRSNRQSAGTTDTGADVVAHPAYTPYNKNE